MRRERFFIDHGMIHDRVTGKHVTTDEDSVFCDGINHCLALLNELSRATGSQWDDDGCALNMCAHGADRGTYCGYCNGYSQGFQDADGGGA